MISGSCPALIDCCYSQCEVIPELQKQISDTEQKLENTAAIVNIVSQKEKETAEKYHQISRQAQQEKKENHRLSLNCEALALKVEEMEFTNSLHISQSRWGGSLIACKSTSQGGEGH